MFSCVKQKIISHIQNGVILESTFDYKLIWEIPGKIADIVDIGVKIMPGIFYNKIQGFNWAVEIMLIFWIVEAMHGKDGLFIV